MQTHKAEQGWWESEPLRIMEVSESFLDLSACDPARDAQIRADHHANVEHLHCMSINAGMDDMRFFFKTSVAGQPHVDRLAAYLPEAHRRGIKVIVYFNVHWYSMEFARKHADWVQIKEDGQPLDGVYKTGTSFCVNSGYREWAFQIVRDLCAYDIDGIFYDGPIFFASTCYCPACQAKYRARYGADLPKKSDRRGVDFGKLLEFQADSLVDFLHDTRAIIKAINPQIAFYMNGGGRTANWPTARLNRKLVAEQDLLGSEGGFIYGDLRMTPLWKPGCEAKLMEAQAGGKPTVIFDCAGHKSWNWYTLPEAEIELLYADTIANAGNVWFAVFPDDVGQPELRAIARMNAHVRDNAAYYSDTRSAAEVALVWSDVTANFYLGSEVARSDFTANIQGSEAGNVYAEFAGFYDALFRNHVPFDVLDDVTLEREELSRYRLIVLPNVAAMSAEAAERLRAWVRAGGTLLGSFETSLYDETGHRLDDFRLGDLFGVRASNAVEGPRRWDYVTATGEAHPLLAGITKRWFPSAAYYVRVAPTAGRSLLSFTEGLAGSYDHTPVTSSDAALVVNRVGQGHAVYLAGDVGNCLDRFRFREYYRLVGNLVAWAAATPVTLGDAPSSLEVVLRAQRDPDRLLLHLVNFTGDMQRPINRINPMEDLRVTLRGLREVSGVRALRSGADLAWSLKDGALEFVLPHVEAYELVAVTGQRG